MDNDLESTPYADIAGRHRRNNSHGPLPRAHSTRSFSQKWEQLARASSSDKPAPPDAPMRSSKSRSPAEMPAPVPIPIPPARDSALSRTKKLSRSMLPALQKHTSHDDLRSTRSRVKNTAQMAYHEPREVSDVNLPRRRSQKTYSVIQPKAHTDSEDLQPIEASQYPYQEQSFDRNTDHSSAAVPPRTRRHSVRPVSTNFSVDRYDSPSHYSHGRSRRMLHLMSITRGSVSGRLFFRRDPTSAWSVAQCSINPQTGSLVSEGTTRSQPEKVLVQNLRGCRVQTLLDPKFTAAILVLRPLDVSDVIQLRPEDATQADRWFAALLCWQPVHPLKSLSGQEDRPKQPRTSLAAADEPMSLDSRGRKDVSIIKVSKVLYLDSSDLQPHGPQAIPNEVGNLNDKTDPISAFPWTRVSCVLRESGELRLYTIATVSTLATIRLPDLTRSSVQRVNSTVFGLDYCIAVCPRQSQAGSPRNRSQPLYLAFESMVLFEVWFVLLRIFAAPEVYGSGWVHSSNLLSSASTMPGFVPDAGPGLFRTERLVHVQIAEARVTSSITSDTVDPGARQIFEGQNNANQVHHHYIRLLLDGHPKGRTTPKPVSSHPFWYESFDIVDLPPNTSHFVIQLRDRVTHNELVATDPFLIQREDADIAPQHTDMPVAEALVDIRGATSGREIESWLPLLDDDGRPVGEILVKVRLDSDVILMDREYQLLSALLHREATSLTVQIAEKIPSELSRLAECLLDIYQSSGQANEWLKSLAEDEIDGVHKDSPTTRHEFDARLDSDSSDAGGSRATHLRELNNAAVAEANLLFRGNTLLSKALDCHMKRLGKDYLEFTLGSKVRAIADADPDCEVDPNKLMPGANLQTNWPQLVALTQEIWSSIYESAFNCPQELRGVFRHIRACTDDHYGERLRNVRYSSVSGFLFLRFFCPAILNPRLFGLMSHNPTPNAQRTFTLIAKSLQVLANQAFFGVKEPWMEPMNQFLSKHKQQFRTFIDCVCSIPPDQESSPLSPSYSTPLAMYTRLPPSSREGFPSLPYLIDHTHQFAILVNLWLDNFPNCSITGKRVTADSFEPDLLQFHNTCVALRRQSQNCLAQLEGRSKRDSNMSEKWMAIAKHMETEPTDFWVDSSNGSTGLGAHIQARVNGNGYGKSSDHKMPAAPLSQDRKASLKYAEELPTAIEYLMQSSPGQQRSAASSEAEAEQRSAKQKHSKGQKGGESTVFGFFGRRKKR